MQESGAISAATSVGEAARDANFNNLFCACKTHALADTKRAGIRLLVVTHTRWVSDTHAC